MREKIIYIIDSVPDYVNTTMYQRIQLLSRHFDLYVILMLPGFPRHFAGSVNHKIFPIKRFLWLFHFLFPLYCLALIKLKGLDNAKMVITSQQPLNLLSGFLIKKLYGMRWVADIYDVPNLALVGAAVEVKSFKDEINVNILKGLDKIVQKILKRSDAVLCTLLPEALERYQVARSKIFPLFNGIDVDAVPPGQEVREKHHFILTYVGVVNPRRGLNTMIHSALQLKKDLPEVKWYLVGPSVGKSEAWMRSQLAGGLSDIVEWTGEIPHHRAIEYLKIADICLLPFPRNYATDYIFPIKIFEYMALGKPIVASRLKGVQELLKPGEDAIFFEPEDADSLTTCIKTLYADKTLRTKLALNVKAKVSSYYWHTINNQLLIYLRKYV